MSKPNPNAISLNPVQQQAVELPSVSAMIIAGAGSGKTKVLTSRIAHLLSTKCASAPTVMAVTFTNKAAREMLERLSHIGVDTKGMWVGTFHGLCNRILRQFHKSANLPQTFQILDVDDCKALIKRLYKANDWSEERLPVKEAYQFIAARKEEGMKPEQVKPDEKNAAKIQVFRAYEDQLQKEGALDFADLLNKTVGLLEENENIRFWAQEKFTHILIDEFQDTNSVQYRWVKLISGNGLRPVFAVGDDDQCVATDTPILMADGKLKMVQEVQVGDEVASADHVGLTTSVVSKIHTSDKLKKVMQIVLGNGRTLVCTPEHQHFVEESPCVRLPLMSLNVRLCANEGSHQLMISGLDASFAARMSSTYGLSTRFAQSAWVAELWTANMSEISELYQKIVRDLRLPFKHTAHLYGSFQVVKQTRHLKVGERLLLDSGHWCAIETIEELDEPQIVFDLNIDKLHNFVASGIVTHNSIYGFRGAKVENMHHFVRDFNVVPEHLLRLEQNYRSQGNILKAANALIDANTGRMGKNLWTEKGDGRKIHLKEALDETQEAHYIAQSIGALRSTSVKPSDVAILYRTNAQSRALEHALFHEGLPYKVHGGLRFFERAEIKYAMAYLRIAANTQDDSALLRVINYPTRGIGAKSIEKLSRMAIEQKCSLWQIIKTESQTSKAPEGIRSIVSLIENLQECATVMSLDMLAYQCISQTGLLALYQADKDSTDRVENLKELVSAAKNFLKDPIVDNPNLEAFLAHASLEAGETGDENTNAVQLMTVHTAKGLEFDHVFIAGLEEGLFPHANSLHNPTAIEEERRLMYVAITRARQELTVSRATERSMFGETKANGASRFLDEIPSELFHLVPGSKQGKKIESIFKDDSYGGRYRSNPEPRRSSSIQSVFSGPIDPNDPTGPGRWVKHSKFGAGQVLKKIGKGDEQTIEVEFVEAGKRVLAMKYVKLESIDAPSKHSGPR